MHSSAAILVSVECAGPQQHNGASPMCIRYTVPEIQLFSQFCSCKRGPVNTVPVNAVQPPPVLPFLVTQNLSPKDIARCDMDIEAESYNGYIYIP